MVESLNTDDANLPAAYLSDLARSGLRCAKGYRYKVQRFLNWLAAKNLPISKMDSQAVNEFLCFRKSSGVGHSTLEGDLSALRHFCRYAIGRNVLKVNPADSVYCSWLHVPGGFPAYTGPLRGLIKPPFFMLRYRLPLFEPSWDKYLRYLRERGYSRASMRDIMRRVAWFHRYLIRRGIKNHDQITPSLVESFLGRRENERAKIGGPSPKELRFTKSSIERFLFFSFRLRGRRFLKPKKRPHRANRSHAELDRYAAFCRQHRGLRPSTLRDNRHWLRRLQVFLKRRKVPRIQNARLADLDAFLAFHAGRVGTRTLPNAVGALRGFFRYLLLKGKISDDVSAQIYSPCRFRMDMRPKYLPWNRIEEMLASIDRRTELGKRDYAILVLLADHGLRAPEVAGLKLPDVDFSAQAIALHGRKNGTSERMPMSTRAMAALKDYLDTRPASCSQEIFVATYAPRRPLGGYVSKVAQRRLLAFFGRLFPAQGAYILRHSFAKAMLDRGARLPEIGALLGHKKLDSTLIYTTVATEDLREVGDNYAGLL